MFTPPPSPQPPMARPHDTPQTPVLEAGSTKRFPPPVDVKRRIARRTRWTIILLPLVLVFITASSRFLVYPMASDIFTGVPGAISWEKLASQALNWTPRKRHRELDARQLASPPTSTDAGPTPTTPANAPVPTIPSSPPALPTPFPQPFDADLTQNFSSISCFNFFSNMTNTQPFRSCRPMSLLLDSSSAFIDAQANLTLLNSLVWGTCNTNTDKDQCVLNIGWFASHLKTACEKDLEDQNSMALTTLNGEWSIPRVWHQLTFQLCPSDLRAYSVMREAGCLTDPTTNTYCYLNAVRNSNPSDLYFYGLPLGTSLPKTTTPSCSACTRSLLALYSASLDDPAQVAVLTGLKKTYQGAADLAVAQCGSGYAVTKSFNSAVSGPRRSLSWWSGGVVVLLCAFLQSLS